jgi:hypothetical protein
MHLIVFLKLKNPKNPSLLGKYIKKQKKTKKPTFFLNPSFFQPCLGRALQGLDGGVEAGVLQRTVVDEHEAVPGDEAAVLLRHAARHQRPDHNYRFLEQRGEGGLVNKLTNQ